MEVVFSGECWGILFSCFFENLFETFVSIPPCEIPAEMAVAGGDTSSDL